MTKILTTLLYINVLLLLSCEGNNQETIIQEEISVIEEPSVKKDNKEDNQVGNPIDFNKTKVLDIIYVTDKNDVHLKEQSDLNSKTLLFLPYGSKLEVIEFLGEWMGVRQSIKRELVENGNMVIRTRWEKVYVQKKSTGRINEIQLSDTDLNVVLYLNKNGESSLHLDGQILDEFLKIELVDKQEYFFEKKNSFTHLKNDLTIEKKDSTISIPCKKGHINFADINDIEKERYEEYKYLGKYDFLNKHVLEIRGGEGISFNLVDINQCKETHVLSAYPQVSPNKKYLIGISNNEYEPVGYFFLFEISDIEIKMIVSGGYKNWMPSVNYNEFFWSTNGYLYFPVLHVKAYWTEKGSYNSNYQYARMKIL